MQRKFLKALQAFSVGDAIGLPTEFMTCKQIEKVYGKIEGVLSPTLSVLHPDLFAASISDDTEQNLALIDTYFKSGISTQTVVQALLEWVEKSNAIEKKFIGPSSLKSLKAIKNGEDPAKTGVGNATSGAAMRVLSVALCTPKESWEELANHIFTTTIPTHNSDSALECAMSLGFAYQAAAIGVSLEKIIQAFFEGSRKSQGYPTAEIYAPSVSKRVEFYLKNKPLFATPHSLCEYLSLIQGTGLFANEVTASAFIIFLSNPEDCWGNICFSASLGGDTDTIAAITGALSALYTGDHNIPCSVTQQILSANHLSLEEYAKQMSALFNQRAL